MIMVAQTQLILSSLWKHFRRQVERGFMLDSSVVVSGDLIIYFQIWKSLLFSFENKLKKM